MRIISGRFKGRRLVSPRGRNIRPTTDRVREAVFSAMGTAVRGARVLELFAGTGAFGFEALSRGAEFVVFVDNDPAAVDLVKQTARALGVQPQVRPLNLGWSKAVDRLAAADERFQVVFLDPPYGGSWLSEVLSHGDFLTLVPQDGLVIIERETRGQGCPVPEGFRRSFDGRYGDTAVEILQRGTTD